MKQAIKHSRGRLWLSVGLPIMLLALATALGGVAILADFAGRQDRAFEQGSQQLVASALRGRMRASSNTTKDYAFWNDAYDAITLGADRRWVETNFTSAVADGIVVFRADGTIRHQWFREGAAADADSLAAAIASQAASQQDLRRMASARDVSDMVVGRMLNVGGQLVIASTAPISREGVRASERARGRPADFVASFDILDQAELNEHGGYVGLADLTFNAEAARPEASDVIAMALPNSSATGWLTWRNQRPGSAGLLNQSLPLVALLLLAGLMAVWVTRRSVTRHLELLAHAEAETEASRAKSEFIATMSHELRTPLNAIIGYSELVKEELADLGIDQSCADLDRIEGAGRHLLRLIEDILDHAKAETGKLSIDSEPLNVFDSLREAATLVEPLALEQNNTLHISVAEDVSDVYADHVRLQQCLLNLLANAAKFTHGGQIRVEARRASANDREAVEIRVSDTGIGIDAAALTRLFAPFVQADASIARTYGGAGLGLSITRRLARAMGGDVSASSELGCGSTFTLTLPAVSPRALRMAA